MLSTTEQNIPPADTAVPQEDVDASNTAVIARQAIVDHNRAVYGYELFDRSTASDAHTAASDAALLFNALSYAGTEALVGKKTVFINCTHESLAGGHLELIHPEKVVLEVPPLPDTATQEEIDQRVPVLQALRERGFRLALNQNALRKPYASWMPLASFIKLDLQTFKPELAGPLVKFASQYAKATLLIRRELFMRPHRRHACRQSTSGPALACSPTSSCVLSPPRAAWPWFAPEPCCQSHASNRH